MVTREIRFTLNSRVNFTHGPSLTIIIIMLVIIFFLLLISYMLFSWIKFRMAPRSCLNKITLKAKDWDGKGKNLEGRYVQWPNWLQSFFFLKKSHIWTIFKGQISIMKILISAVHRDILAILGRLKLTKTTVFAYEELAKSRVFEKKKGCFDWDLCTFFFFTSGKRLVSFSF